MSLYDIMNKKPKQEVVAPVVEPVEAPVVAEEKAPAPKTYAVKDSEAIARVAAPVQEAPQTVTQEKKPYTWWWQTPDFVGAVESQAKAAEKRAEQDRKRAVRQRNAAILGDLAKLGAQMYAKKGGAWKMDAFTPATEKANDKLAALRERHAAEVAAFARERAAAKQAQIADNNARMKLETSLAEADLDREIKAKMDARDFAYKVAKDEFDAKIAEQNAESRRISANASAEKASGGSGKPDKDDKPGNRDWISEYWRRIRNYPEFAIYLIDERGDPIEKDGKPVFNPYITEKQAESVVKRITEFATARDKKYSQYEER